MSRVVVGLSGGVDSSVAAVLLKEAGHEVIGIYMRNWNDESVTINNECPWVEDSNDALVVAQKLNIPFHTLDLSGEYKQRIVDYMFAEYKAGRTPNPDVLCNREIKFDVFLQAALQLGADFVATGHYCRKLTTLDKNGHEIFHLCSGADIHKDQSYFLCQVSQEQLRYALFPIGHLQKKEVREIAARYDLITADKKDSQGLCFVGKVKLPVFLQQQLMPKPGDIIAIPASYYAGKTPDTLLPVYYQRSDGQKIGTHQGAHYYTVGQRKGLHIGGTAEPMFVLHTDVKENIVYTGMGENHPGLYRRGLIINNNETHWIRPDKKLQPGSSARYMVRIRYRQKLEPALLTQEAQGLTLFFDEPQKAITPGQFAAWYEGDELLGSGVINA